MIYLCSIAAMWLCIAICPIQSPECRFCSYLYIVPVLRPAWLTRCFMTLNFQVSSLILFLIHVYHLLSLLCYHQWLGCSLWLLRLSQAMEVVIMQLIKTVNCFTLHEVAASL